MNYRPLGRTGLEVSEVAFGCGLTAGLMVRGSQAERRSVVEHALQLGINYFDTAPIYGDGLSEQHLGEALRELGAEPLVASKVALTFEQFDDIEASVTRSVERSLRLLGRDVIDILQLHNRVGVSRQPKSDSASGALLPLASVDDMLAPSGVAHAFERLRQQGKVRFLGCCAFGGDMPALRQVLDSSVFDTVLVHYSILNPSAARPAPPGLLDSDYEQVMQHAAAREAGIVVLRALEGGALSGLKQPHRLAGEPVRAHYHDKLERAGALAAALADDRYNLAQQALRFALARPEVAAVLVGFSAASHVDDAIATLDAEPLSPSVLAAIEDLYEQF